MSKSNRNSKDNNKKVRLQPDYLNAKEVDGREPDPKREENTNNNG